MRQTAKSLFLQHREPLQNSENKFEERCAILGVVFFNVSRSGVKVSSPRTERTGNAVQVWSLIAAAVLTAFYFAASLYVSTHRLFWIDEIVSVDIAWLPRWSTMWTALANASDSMPPVHYIVVRLFGSFLGHNELAARLPSALAMAAGLLITFDCARRLTDAVHGLIAFSVLPCTFLLSSGFEARSYAIYFMLSALMLWVWTCTRDDRKLPALFFGLALCLAITVHYYAVFAIVPCALWELSRWRPWQRPSRKLIAGVLGAALAAALLSPMIVSFTHRFSGSFFGPAVSAAPWIYDVLFPDGLFLLALCMVWVALIPGRNVELEAMPAYESVSWLFLCIPLAGWVVARLQSHLFHRRYFICVLPGVAVAFACWIWRHSRNTYRVSAGILLLLTAWGLAKQVQLIRNPEEVVQAETRQYLGLEDSLFKDGKKFIVFSDHSLFWGGRYYSRHPEEFIFLLDPRKDRLNILGIKLAMGLSRYYPLRLWELDDLKQHAGEAALILPDRETLDALEKAGFEVETRFSGPVKVVYVK